MNVAVAVNSVVVGHLQILSAHTQAYDLGHVSLCFHNFQSTYSWSCLVVNNLPIALDALNTFDMMESNHPAIVDELQSSSKNSSTVSQNSASSASACISLLSLGDEDTAPPLAQKQQQQQQQKQKTTTKKKKKVKKLCDDEERLPKD